MDKLADYYAQRAAEYERIYAKPERQADLAALRDRIGRRKRKCCTTVHAQGRPMAHSSESESNRTA